MSVELWRDLLVPLDSVVTEMEHRGVHVNLGFNRLLDTVAEADERDNAAALAAWYSDVDAVGPEMPPNWNSPQQLVTFLHTPLGLNLPKSPFWKFGKVKGDEVKTDATALKWLAGQFPEHRAGIQLLLDHRKITKSRQYFSMIEEHALDSDTGPRIHATFSVAGDDDDRAGAVTGRFAIKNPALAGIPIRDSRYAVRDIFTAPEGEELVIVDYSTLEVVVLAHLLIALFGDDSLAHRIRVGTEEDPVPDIHSATASFVFDEVLQYPECRGKPLTWYKQGGKPWRELVKAIRYGLNYGKGAWGFGNTLFLPNGDPLGEPAAQKMMDALFRMDPGIQRYIEWIPWYVRKHRGIPSLLGRWCDLSHLVPSPDEWHEKRAFRRAMNFPMQAGGQEITARAMIAIEHCPLLRRLGARQILQIHDEIVLRCPLGAGAEVRDRVIHLMLNSQPLRCPLQAAGHFGRTWGAKA